MLDNKDYWNQYFKNLDRFLDSNDQEIVSYVYNLKQQSENLKSGTLSFLDYKKIPPIDINCQNKLIDLTEQIRTACSDLDNQKITVEEFRVKFNIALEIRTQKENSELRYQINYIKDKLLKFYWKKD